MPMSSVMISDLLEPHADLSLLQFCSRHKIRANSRPRPKTPTENHLRSLLWITLSLLGPKLVPKLPLSLNLGPHSLFFFSISNLPLFFHTPLSSFSSTSVLPFSRNVLLPSGYVSTIGLVVACGLHSSRIVRRVCPERWFTLGDPARSDDEKTPNRKFPQTAVFAYGAPRQPPLQDYAVDAHPSLRP